jgi:hypothetical protein
VSLGPKLNFWIFCEKKGLDRDQLLDILIIDGLNEQEFLMFYCGFLFAINFNHWNGHLQA